MFEIDLVMRMDPEYHMTDVVDKLKIVRTFQAKLNGYNLDLIIPVEEANDEKAHLSAAQISGRTRQVINEGLTACENYLIHETGILTSIRTYLSTTTAPDRHHIDDLFDELHDYTHGVLPISKAIDGRMVVCLLFARLKLRHFIENGKFEDDYFLRQLDFPKFDRRSVVHALFRSGGLDLILEGYKARLVKFELDSLTVTDRRINHYLTRLLSEIIEVRQGGGSYLDMVDKDISRDDESRVIRLLEMMESETPMGGDEFLFAVFSDCYLQGFNLFR